MYIVQLYMSIMAMTMIIIMVITMKKTKAVMNSVSEGISKLIYID